MPTWGAGFTVLLTTLDGSPCLAILEFLPLKGIRNVGKFFSYDDRVSQTVHTTYTVLTMLSCLNLERGTDGGTIMYAFLSRKHFPPSSLTRGVCHCQSTARFALREEGRRGGEKKTFGKRNKEVKRKRKHWAQKK